MRVGWLTDVPSFVGGAELTQAEFLAAVPSEVEIVACPPGNVQPDIGRYVVHNHLQYSSTDLQSVRGKVFVYRHDMRRQPVRAPDATEILCSPIQGKGHMVPPALDIARFALLSSPPDRQGTCWVGRLQFGKGIPAAVQWARENGVVDFYGEGPLAPTAEPCVKLCGEVPYAQIPGILWRYAQYIFLPTEPEPFGRGVAEAWFAGCELITNRNVGALYWIEQDPEGLETAGEKF